MLVVAAEGVETMLKGEVVTFERICSGGAVLDRFPRCGPAEFFSPVSMERTYLCVFYRLNPFYLLALVIQCGFAARGIRNRQKLSCQKHDASQSINKSAKF